MPRAAKKKRKSIHGKRLSAEERQALINEPKSASTAELAKKYNVSEHTVRQYRKGMRRAGKKASAPARKPSTSTRFAARNIEVTSEGKNVVLKMIVPMDEFFKESAFGGLLA